MIYKHYTKQQNSETQKKIRKQTFGNQANLNSIYF